MFGMKRRPAAATAEQNLSVPKTDATAVQEEHAAPPVRTIRTDDSLSGLAAADLLINGSVPRLVLAYVSPNVDFQTVMSRLQRLAEGAMVIGTTTAGELCAEAGEGVYCSASGNWRSVVLQVFGGALVEKARSLPCRCTARTCAADKDRWTGRTGFSASCQAWKACGPLSRWRPDLPSR